SEVRRDSLLNGLQVMMIERANEPMVKIDLVVRGGSMFDLTGKTGLATLTQESLLAVNPRLVEELESLQSKVQWGVNEDATWFHIEAPPSKLDQVLSIFARLIVVDSVNKDAFTRAQKLHLDQVRGLKLTPAEKADEAFFAALYGEFPYGHNITGTDKTVEAITYGDVYDYYKRLYAANNAFAVVVSNLKQDRIMTSFRMNFGGWLKGAPPPPVFRPPQRATELRIVKVEQPDLSMVELRGGIIGVKVSDPEFIATQILARVLESRIKQAIGDANQISVKALPRVLAGPIYFSASVAVDRAPDLSRKVTDIFAALNKTEITAQELAAAQAGLLDEHNARSVEEYLRMTHRLGLPRNYPVVYADKVKGVTTIDLQAVAKKLLEANALTVVVLGRVNDGFKS
ncbi:MAG TPA: pitrilysin family protein, partial [Blastocatellia bacterium]|nr:pitrilysin family protein [Blastocatellia bacterium]